MVTLWGNADINPDYFYNFGRSGDAVCDANDGFLAIPPAYRQAPAKTDIIGFGLIWLGLILMAAIFDRI